MFTFPPWKLPFTRMKNTTGRRKFELSALCETEWERMTWVGNRLNFWNLVHAEETCGKPHIISVSGVLAQLGRSTVSTVRQTGLGARNLWTLCIWMVPEDRRKIHPSLNAKAKEASRTGQKSVYKDNRKRFEIQGKNLWRPKVREGSWADPCKSHALREC